MQLAVFLFYKNVAAIFGDASMQSRQHNCIKVSEKYFRVPYVNSWSKTLQN